MKTTRIPPGPRERIPFANLPAAHRDVIGFLKNVSMEYGDIAYFKIGPLSFALLNHPEVYARLRDWLRPARQPRSVPR